MRHVLVIGIGAGDPEQLTLEAVRALNRTDVIYVIEKGTAADELGAMRRALLDRHLEPGRAPRVVSLADPPRDRAAAYSDAVEDWRARRADVWEGALGALHGTGAFLVWGDPAIYDSTIAILDQILARGRVEFGYEVVPGISSLQLLAARHRIPWNRVAGAVQITTGRRLAADGWPPGVDDVVVMLDADCSFRHLDPAGLEVYWGAYLGTPDELLVAGPLAEAGKEIERVRAAARARKGWIMDTYLLRRSRAAE
jgi:precorrin-6A synthase